MDIDLGDMDLFDKNRLRVMYTYHVGEYQRWYTAKQAHGHLPNYRHDTVQSHIDWHEKRAARAALLLMGLKGDDR